MFLLAILLAPVTVSAHCQVPCGIYDDHARIHSMLEDQSTIAKAILKISELVSKSDATSRNQTVRWINTKEQHASRIITVISEYFLTQKIKPAAKKNAKERAQYLANLADAHAVMRAAMKCKHGVDPAAASALKTAIETFGKRYPRSK
ncbi:MAG TPA: superoxide dismutase [Myxococcales bacterium]|nr:superoxide dismutase [Myxococcales bacterium]